MLFTTDTLLDPLDPTTIDPAEWAKLFEDEWINPSDSSGLFSHPINDADAGTDMSAINASSPSQALDDLAEAQALAAIGKGEESPLASISDPAAVPKLVKDTPAASELSRDELLWMVQRMWTETESRKRKIERLTLFSDQLEKWALWINEELVRLMQKCQSLEIMVAARPAGDRTDWVGSWALETGGEGGNERTTGG